MNAIAAKPGQRAASRRKRQTERLVIDGGGKTKAFKKSGSLQFGSVTLRVSGASASELSRNVELGQAALKKMKRKLAKPGVRLSRRKGVPLFYADPSDPRRLIRELDGLREVGIFENGIFKVLA